MNIRPLLESDAPAMQAIYAPIVETGIASFEEEVPTVDEIRRRVRKILSKWTGFVAEHDGRTVGYAYGTSHRARAAYRWSVETAVYVDPSARGSGVGRALYEALLPALVERGYRNAYAGITLPNPASVSLHRALGFEPIGTFERVGYKFGEWRDVAWFQLALSDERPTPQVVAPPVRNFDLRHSLDLLARTPAVLNAWLRGLDPAWIMANEGPDTWSAYDVVGHLIHGEETDWVGRARIILEYGAKRTFEPFDRFAQKERFAGWPLEDLLDRFAELRARNLATVERWDLSPEQLELTGRHPEFGVVHLHQLLATWVVHDTGHLAQISRVMAKRYGEDVGPWRAYLPVLGPSP